MSNSKTKGIGPVRGNINPEALTLRELFHILPISRLWKISAAIVALIVGVAALGGYIQKARDDSQSTVRERTVSELAAKNQSLSNEIADLNRALEATGQMLENLRIEEQTLRGEIEFLNRYLSYQLSPNEASKATFVNMVCAMWRESTRRRVQIEREPLRLSPAQIQRGLSPEVQRLLKQRGISDATIQQATAPPTIQRKIGVAPFVGRTTEINPGVRRAISDIQKQAGNIGLTKRVMFPDGLSFEVPPEIAFEVHTSANCAP